MLSILIISTILSMSIYKVVKGRKNKDTWKTILDIDLVLNTFLLIVIIAVGVYFNNAIEHTDKRIHNTEIVSLYYDERADKFEITYKENSLVYSKSLKSDLVEVELSQSTKENSYLFRKIDYVLEPSLFLLPATFDKDYEIYHKIVWSSDKIQVINPISTSTKSKEDWKMY